MSNLDNIFLGDVGVADRSTSEDISEAYGYQSNESPAFANNNGYSGNSWGQRSRDNADYSVSSVFESIQQNQGDKSYTPDDSEPGCSGWIASSLSILAENGDPEEDNNETSIKSDLRFIERFGLDSPNCIVTRSESVDPVLDVIESLHKDRIPGDSGNDAIKQHFDGLTGEEIWPVSLFDEYGVYGSSTQSNPAEVSRFPEVTAEEIESSIANAECQATKNVTAWSQNVFNAWRHQYMEKNSTAIVPPLSGFSASDVVKYLPIFFFCARKQDGSDYIPRSVYGLASGILRQLRSFGKHDLNFLESKNTEFEGVRQAIDARMKVLANNKVGLHVQHADPILPDAERILWDTGVLGYDTAERLVNTIFFYNCKLFGLRGRDEHRSLSVDDYHIDEYPGGRRIRFEGGRCKNYQGGLKQFRLEPKAITHLSPHGSNPCIVSVFEAYIDAIEYTDPFYRRPLSAKSGSKKIRFSAQAIGVHTLGGMMKKICTDGGLSGNFTNHSGKHTAATQLFHEGIDEQLVCARTGHRSTAVRSYKHSNQALEVKVSQILGPPQQTAKESVLSDRPSSDYSHPVNSCQSIESADSLSFSSNQSVIHGQPLELKAPMQNYAAPARNDMGTPPEVCRTSQLSANPSYCFFGQQGNAFLGQQHQQACPPTKTNQQMSIPTTDALLVPVSLCTDSVTSCEMTASGNNQLQMPILHAIPSNQAAFAADPARPEKLANPIPEILRGATLHGATFNFYGYPK